MIHAMCPEVSAHPLFKLKLVIACQRTGFCDINRNSIYTYRVLGHIRSLFDPLTNQTNGER